MERLNERIKMAEKALAALHAALSQGTTDIVRDASIQRFEFSVEAVWKLAQLHLRKNAGLELGSPKAVIRASFQEQLLDETQTSLALSMIDDRNLTVHTYNENLAREIFSRLPSYSDLMNLWVKNIQSTLS